jgi:hypothetical protein
MHDIGQYLDKVVAQRLPRSALEGHKTHSKCIRTLSEPIDEMAQK